MKKIFILLLLSIAFNGFAQKEYYFGFGIGPKYDHYSLTRSASSVGASEVKIIKDIGAVAGITLGINLDSKNAFELGLFRNNYVSKFSISTSQNNLLFEKEVVNTLNTYLVPLCFNHRIRSGEKQVFWFGGGLSLLLNPKTEFLGSFSKSNELTDVNNQVIDKLTYTRYQHKMEGSLYSFNVQTGMDFAVAESIFLSVGLTGRLGIAGSDMFLIETEDTEGKALFKVSNNGSSAQLIFGFKYFMTSKPGAQ